MATQKRMNDRRRRRAFRARRHVRGTAARPRLSVHRTHRHLYAQLIDDLEGRTLCSVSSLALKIEKGGGVEAAKAVGQELGKKAKSLNIVRCGFDRGAFRYHGRVKALADAVRSSGVEF